MLLNSKNIKSIKNTKVTYIKKFTQIFETYDFNKISTLVDDFSLFVQCRAEVTRQEFKDIWQMKNIHDIDSSFFTYLDFFYKTFRYEPEVRDGVDIFFSFVTNTGVSHVDTEDVFLIGLYGKTIYRIIDVKQDYVLKSGDLLYIPKGIRHKAISATPRAVASVGYYGGKKYAKK